MGSGRVFFGRGGEVWWGCLVVDVLIVHRVSILVGDKTDELQTLYNYEFIKVTVGNPFMYLVLGYPLRFIYGLFYPLYSSSYVTVTYFRLWTRLVSTSGICTRLHSFYRTVDTLIRCRSFPYPHLTLCPLWLYLFFDQVLCFQGCPHNTRVS